MKLSVDESYKLLQVNNKIVDILIRRNVIISREGKKEPCCFIKVFKINVLNEKKSFTLSFSLFLYITAI